MVKKIIDGPIDCACVIYGDAYSWEYVERLYNMLSKNISKEIRFHVYTEASRVVPDHMIKHTLTEWNITDPKKLWWYKMQMFNPDHHAGPLLYFDLDVIIVRNIDWIWQNSVHKFWSIRDFKYLQKPTHRGINSSIMWWDTEKFKYVWDNFNRQKITEITKQYRGDQDYITATINSLQIQYFNLDYVQSFRWQCLDGGYDFTQRKFHNPGAGAVIPPNASVLIFHGKPKPDQVDDPEIIKLWR